MVGNFWKFKNQAFAIELIRQLPANFTFDMYGMVNDEDYYKELKELIEEYNLSDRISFKHGVNDIYKVLEGYNFAIHTSPHETGPLVLLEYMQVGLPFLTYNTGDVASNMRDVLNELIVDTFEIPDWISRIETVMMNEDKRRQIVEKMKDLLKEKYSEDNYVNKLQTIYNKVLHKRIVA
jgi:glycosyltransferase involved in cell wall biosynthesis